MPPLPGIFESFQQPLITVVCTVQGLLLNNIFMQNEKFFVFSYCILTDEASPILYVIGTRCYFQSISQYSIMVVLTSGIFDTFLNVFLLGTSLNIQKLDLKIYLPSEIGLPRPLHYFSHTLSSHHPQHPHPSKLFMLDKVSGVTENDSSLVFFKCRALTVLKSRLLELLV